MKVINHYNQRWLWFGTKGVVFGNHIFYTDSDPPDWIRRHEEEHVRQMVRLSPFGLITLGALIFWTRWPIEYLMGLVCYRDLYEAYSQISFEIQAREVET